MRALCSIGRIDSYRHGLCGRIRVFQGARFRLSRNLTVIEDSRHSFYFWQIREVEYLAFINRIVLLAYLVFSPKDKCLPQYTTSLAGTKKSISNNASGQNQIRTKGIQHFFTRKIDRDLTANFLAGLVMIMLERKSPQNEVLIQ